jgi:hypothetical protein
MLIRKKKKARDSRSPSVAGSTFCTICNRNHGHEHCPGGQQMERRTVNMLPPVCGNVSCGGVKAREKLTMIQRAEVAIGSLCPSFEGAGSRGRGDESGKGESEDGRGENHVSQKRIQSAARDQRCGYKVPRTRY